MILERAEIFIKEELMDEFLEVFAARALPLTRTFSGCLSFEALRGVEHPDSIMFLSRWESVQAHLSSRLEADHTEFRELVLQHDGREGNGPFRSNRHPGLSSHKREDSSA